MSSVLANGPHNASPSVRGSTESTVIVRPRAGSSCGTNGANVAASWPAPLGGGGPVKRPVVALMVHARVGSSVVVSSPNTPDTTAAYWMFVAALRGVTRLVMRGDSSDVGPDLSEFRSKAVTE